MNIGNKLSAAKAVVTSKAGLSLLKGSKHSPAILFGAGVIGFGATVVLASKASLKLEGLVTEHERKLGEAHDVMELGRLDKLEYSEKDYKKDTAVLKVRFVKEITRLYAPAAIVGLASVGALTGSHIVLNRRYSGVVAAYATLDKSFKDYQKRVVERYGPDADKELKFGSENIERAIDTDKDTKVETVTIAEGASQYARFFSKETSPNSWSPLTDYNLVFLQAQQRYANDLLLARGHVMLNDVYDSLGLERSKAGCVVGWVKGHGDNMIDFGIYEHPDRFHDFMVGREGAILLDFNVDGVVYDLI